MKAKGFQLHRSSFIRLLAFTVLATMVFYAIGIYLNHMGTVNAENSIKQMAESKVEYIASEVERSVLNVRTHEQEIAEDESLVRMAVAADVLSDYQRTVCIRNLSNELFRIRRMSTIVNSAAILLPGLGRVIAAEETIYDDMRPADEVMLEALEDMPAVAMLPYEGGVHLTLRRSFGTQQAVICLGIDYGLLMQKLNDMSIEPDAQVFLLLENGDEAVAGEGVLRPAEGVGDQPRLERTATGEFVYAEAALPSVGLRVQYCRRADAIMDPFARHGGWTWVLTVVALGLMIAYLLYFRMAILHPLNTIYEAMAQVESPGEFHIEESGNEFQEIYGKFQYMINRLERLASEVYEERYRAKNAELAQLQTQINPHFFYNTLFLIYRLARDEGCDDIAQLSEHLSRFYRYITKSPGQTVALRDEIEHISNYLEIQRIRFQPRITIEAEPLPEAIAEERIPSLIIQPLVENAFTHGVRDAAWRACVSIRYEYGDDWFRVTVADNGGQMTPERVEDLKRKLAENAMPEGSALSNLKRRMELRYGEGYTLELACIDNGLTASVTFPRKKEDSDHALTVDRG